MLVRFNPSTLAIHSPLSATHSAIPLGLSSPHNFARNISSKIVASAYRFPLALRPSVNPSNRRYRLPRSISLPVLRSILTFLVLFVCALHNRITEKGHFSSPHP
jgi:hypothetical protein